MCSTLFAAHLSQQKLLHACLCKASSRRGDSHLPRPTPSPFPFRFPVHSCEVQCRISPFPLNCSHLALMISLFPNHVYRTAYNVSIQVVKHIGITSKEVVNCGNLDAYGFAQTVRNRECFMAEFGGKTYGVQFGQ